MSVSHSTVPRSNSCFSLRNALSSVSQALSVVGSAVSALLGGAAARGAGSLASMGAQFWKSRNPRKLEAAEQPNSLPSPVEKFDRFIEEATGKRFPALTPFQREERYDFLRRLDRGKLKDELAFTFKWPEASPNELAALKNLDTAHPIFQRASLRVIALREFVSGNLTRDEIANLFIFAECKNRYGTEGEQLISQDGRRNGDAIEFLSSHLGGMYSREEIERFLQSVEELPPERSRIYFAENGEGRANSSVLHGIFKFIGNFLMHPIKDDEKSMNLQLIVLTPELTYLLHKAKFGENAIRPNPVLGLSSQADFKKTDRRDVYIPASSSLLDLPVTADGYLTFDPLQVMMHDLMYHCLIESANPHRAVYSELAAYCEDPRTQEPFPGYERVVHQFTDREFLIYIYRLQSGENCYFKDMPEPVHFWREIVESIPNRELSPTKPGPLSRYDYYRVILDRLLGARLGAVADETLNINFDSLKWYLENDCLNDKPELLKELAMQPFMRKKEFTHEVCEDMSRFLADALTEKESEIDSPLVID